MPRTNGLKHGLTRRRNKNTSGHVCHWYTRSTIRILKTIEYLRIARPCLAFSKLQGYHSPDTARGGAVLRENMLTTKFLTALLTLALAIPVAQAQRETTPVPQAAPTSAPILPAAPDESALQSHGHYRNKEGKIVHSPAKSLQDQIPSGASAKCRDGTYSFSQNRRGTCSHHGGVGSWL